MASNLKPMKSTSISSSLVNSGLDKEQLRVLEVFCYLVYQSSDHEITAKTTETYATVKERLGQHDPKGLLKIEDEEEEEIVTAIIKDSYGWDVAKMMVNYDIFQEFQKLDQDTTIRFFSHIKDFNNFIKLHDNGWLRFLEIIKTIIKLSYINKTQKVSLISEDEVIDLMEEYNKYINSQGLKLKKKIGKIYAHFI